MAWRRPGDKSLSEPMMVSLLMHICVTRPQWVDSLPLGDFNSLVPGKFEWHFRYLIFQIISVINGWGISCELALRLMLLALTDNSTLVQVMAWCCQATSHYLSQWWPRSLSPYGVTRPQWVNEILGKLILVIDGWGISSEIAHMEMPLDLTNDRSTLVQVMAWCRQATSHHLNQCWPTSFLPYGATRPQFTSFLASQITSISTVCSTACSI